MASAGKRKILVVASEAVPFSKTGGLGDVIGSLPQALFDAGAEVRVVIPAYRAMQEGLLHNLEFIGSYTVRIGWRRQRADVLRKNGDVPVYLIKNDYYFGRDALYGYADDAERFAFFCRAALDLLTFLDFYPDVIHCHDWQTGPLCYYLRELYGKMVYYAKIKLVYTIHNLQYQGNFGFDILELLEASADKNVSGIEFYGKISYMKMALNYTDCITTVSKTYAKEIQTPEFGYGMDGVIRNRSALVCGIPNGIDHRLYDPAQDERIVAPYSAKEPADKQKNKLALQKELGLFLSEAPILGMVTRLADQKGLDLLIQVFQELMEEDVQVVLLGTGDSRYEAMFENLAKRYPGRVSVNLFFDDTLAQKIYAGSDFFLMPSLFEPCGLGQLIALRYGTLPIVRRTGGLADTVTHFDEATGTGNGFLFETFDGNGLLWGIRAGLRVYHQKALWQQAVQNAMESDFSWGKSALAYLTLYDRLITTTGETALCKDSIVG